jgi:uncharacterized protein
MRITLSLTHRCNLACDYCYSGKPLAKDMSYETAKKAIDFGIGMLPPGHKADICFFGGEPLLCFDLMKELTAYINKQQISLDIPVRVSVSTNGTLLNQAMLSFLRDKGVDLCVSIDGTADVHDLHRRYPDGRGTFGDVARNLAKAIGALGYVQVNAVYGPDTVDYLAETVSGLVRLGAHVIHLNPNICASWEDITYARLREAYMGVAEYYTASYRRGDEIAISLIDNKAILFLKGGYAREDVCGMGETEWGFAPSGNIYPCERFVGEDSDLSLCLGNVNTGLDRGRRCALLKRRGNRNAECRACDYRAYCMNWCGCTNHYMTGSTDRVGPIMCASERALIEAARYVFMALAGADNDLFIDHLMRYLDGGHRYQRV